MKARSQQLSTNFCFTYVVKNFERHLSNQLNSFLKKFNVLETLQSGFRENVSCQIAHIPLVDEWLNDIDSGNVIGFVFVDLKKSFRFGRSRNSVAQVKATRFF